MFLPYYTYGMDNKLLLALLFVMVLGFIAQGRVQSQFTKYSKVRASAGMPAHVVAGNLLREGSSHAEITPVGGSLTDHYNPRTNVVGLSQTVYNDTSVAALAVAAHEIGHVMQYQDGYGPIKLRNAILPVANIGSQAAPLIVLAGLLFDSFNLAFVGVILFAAMLLFQLVTLPVEFNASSRALSMLQNGGYLTYEEVPQAKKVLRAAAFTYVVAALSSVLTLIRLMLLAGRTKRD